MSVNPGLFTSLTPEWSTPQWLFDELHREFRFTLDVCATKLNAKCHAFLDDWGLQVSWRSETCWMNPPYGRGIKDWIKKAYEESQKKNTTVVALIPARTDTKYWHDYVLKAHELYFVKGRLKFGNGENSAPFPSAVVIFRDGLRNAYLDFPQIGVL